MVKSTQGSSALVERVAQMVEKDGIQAWFDLDAEALIGKDAENYVKVMDTLDVWFDSGSDPRLRGRCPAKNSTSRPICIWKALTSTAAGSCLL